MLPKLLNRITHILPSSPADCAGPPPPIASVAVGTAGSRRSWQWALRMDDAGALDRVQSLLIYDCNQKTIADIEAEIGAQSRQPGRRQVNPLPVILPDFLPMADGFLGDPNAYRNYLAPIRQDLGRMVDALAARAEEVGSPPQLILEWFGFGGHAKLGGVLQLLLLARFPEAIFLPVILLPRDRLLEENMRRETWAAYEEMMSLPGIYSGKDDEELRGFPAIITDNRIAHDARRLDDKLAIGLASLAASMAYDADSDSLAQTVSSFRGCSNGWLGMRVLSRRVDVAPAAAPRRREPPLITSADPKQLVWETKKAMWDIVDARRTDLDLARHQFVDSDSVMRMVVSMPIDAAHLPEMERDVAKQLDRDDFAVAYPNLKWSFASANFGQPDADHRMHIALFFPLQDDNIESIADIMMPDGNAAPAPFGDGLPQTGFGTGHYLGNGQ